MKHVNYPNRARSAISIKKNDYQKVLGIILKYTDIVCFTVSPYLDDLTEVKEDIRYQEIYDSYFDSEVITSIHTEICNESLIYFKMDYFVREFLKNKEDMFDFLDDEAPINLEDVVFIGNGQIVCDTITHENYCGVIDEVYDEIEKSVF